MWRQVAHMQGCTPVPSTRQHHAGSRQVGDQAIVAQVEVKNAGVRHRNR